MVTTKTDDPWTDISPPNSQEKINLRRVDTHIEWDFFWGKSESHHCLLVLRHKPESQPQNRLPNFRNLEVTLDKNEFGGKITLILKLLDSNQRNLFLVLCHDIIASTKSASSELEAVALTVARTWRWYHLLRSGLDQRLSPEEQKGLIGELIILQDTLLPILSPIDAVSAWSGPLGHPKDFECKRVCIESKARGGAVEPSIKISTEHQLELENIDTLFLYVRVIDRASEDSPASFTITELAQKIFQELIDVEPFAATLLEERLMASGFLREHDYTDYRWLLGNTSIFHVTNDFPRIVASNLHQGISNVRYKLAMASCIPFRTSDEFVKNSILGN